jgi:hypothetical protein
MIELLARYQAYRAERGSSDAPLHFKAENKKRIIKVVFDSGLTDSERKEGTGRFELTTSAPLPAALDLFLGIYRAKGGEEDIFIRDHWSYSKGLAELGAEVCDSSYGSQYIFSVTADMLEKLAAAGFMVHTENGTASKFFMHELWTPDSDSSASHYLCMRRSSTLDHELMHQETGRYEALLSHISKVEEALKQWNERK